MKETITLTQPILINGKTVKTLTYDVEEITCEAFAEADARKLKSTGGGATGAISGAAELDYSFHLYLGFAAIIAVNPEIDFNDLARIKGPDIMEVMRIGRNFISAKSEEPSAPEDSAALLETTPEPSTLPFETSSDSESLIS